MTPFEKSLSKLAGIVAEKAMEKSTSFAETIDAFKTLITYYGAIKKHKAPSEDLPDEADFGAFQAELEKHSNGATQIRDRSGAG